MVESDFSRSHEIAFRKEFAGEVTETLTYPQGDISALRSVLVKVKQLKSRALFVPEVSSLLLGLNRELKNAGLGDIPVFSIFAAQAPDVVEVNGDSIAGLSISYPDIGTEDALTYFPS